jgi:hypothetical protein
MKAKRSNNAYVARGPFWLPDAHERFKALLPELLLSIVATSSALTVMMYSDGANIGNNALLAIVIQTLLQSMFYILTYLTSNPGMTSLLAIFGTSLLSLFPMMTFGNAPANSPGLGVGASIYMLTSFGAVLFYLTRLRGTLIYVLMSVAVLGSAFIESDSPIAIFHLVSTAAYMAIFIIRSSPSRITVSSFPLNRPATHEVDKKRHLPVPVQAMLLAAGVSILSLLLAIGIGWRQGWSRSVDTSGSFETTVDIEHEDRVTPVDGTTGEGGHEGTALEGLEELAAEGGETTPAASGTSSARSGLPRALWAAIAVVAVMALLVLPFAIRLLLRKRTRRSIEGEASPADRAARIYLKILSRLGALGIERSEDETPHEFLVLHAKDLLAISEVAGLDENCWQTITSVYEKARYAGLDATEAEIDACWQVFDALPAYARLSMGWPGYLAGLFWLM